MIIVDMSKVMYAVVFVFRSDILRAKDQDEITKIIRTASITSMLTCKRKFGFDYGELIIAIDGRDNFRYIIHPNYKYKRQKTREKDDLPWNMIRASMRQVEQEAREYWPWACVWSERAEADDVMGVLVEDVANKNIQVRGVLDEEIPEPVLLDTRDQDLFQLHKYSNVKQWDSRERKFITLSENYDEFMKDFVICGDPESDSVPNIFSELTCFVDGVRQTPASKARIAQFDSMTLSDMLNHPDEKLKKRINENFKLVCFDAIPLDIRDEIVECYKNRVRNKKLKMYHYLLDTDCSLLADSVGEM